MTAQTPRMFVHSCHVRTKNPEGDAVVVKEYRWHPDGQITPELQVHDNPKRKFFITKPMYRTHDEKKEAEKIERVDAFTVQNHRLETEIFKQLEGYYPRQGRPRLRELCDSPYVYGADIAIETLVKAKYKKDFFASGKDPVRVTSGFFDTETSVHPGTMDQLTIASVTHENKVYTAILRRVFYRVDEHGERIPGTIEELAEFSRSILQPEIDRTFKVKGLSEQAHRNNFEFHYYVGETPEDLLRWIFARMHENRTDFIGVWNLKFDVGVVLRTLKEAGIPPEEVMCPPELPARYRMVKFVKDEKKTDHFTKKWDWLHCTSYSQWYDATCLYSNLRTVIGKETTYSLDYILKRNGVGGKLYFKDLPNMDHLGGTDWHRKMQRDYPFHYIVYNQWDVVSLQLMEWKNQDVASMYLLSEVSSLAKYTRQTRKAADQIYFKWLEKGRVLASAGTTMVGPYDHLIPKVGGAVLRPERVDYAGLYALREAPHIRTMVHIMVNDVDFTGMYPNVAMGANVSKDTKLSTVLGINLPGANDNQKQKAVEEVFSCMVSPHENAVYMGTTFFGLPGYEEMGELFSEELKKEMIA